MAHGTPLQTLPEDVPSHSPWRAVKYTLIGIVAAAILAIVIAIVWAAGRYQAGVELARKAREQYGQLNTRFPFQPPRAGQAGPGGRWALMLDARGQVQHAAGPELKRLISSLLDTASLASPDVYRRLLAGIPLLDQALGAQLAALQREQMSPREYQWLLGLAIATALESPASHPAGKIYREVLDKLERLSRTDQNPDNDVVAQDAVEFFRKAYQGTPRPGDNVMRELQCRDEAEAALDLLTAAAQWAQGEGGPAAESAVKGLIKK